MTRRQVMVRAGVGVLVFVVVAALAAVAVSISRAQEGGAASSDPVTSAAQTAKGFSVGTSGTAVVQAAPTQVSGEPFRTCQACHPDYLSKPDPAGDLVFSHKTHIDNKVQCATCHVPPLGHFDTPAPMMMTCLSCHEGQTAPNDCKNCHRKLEQIAPGLGEPAVHLEPDAKTRKSCAKCHDVKVWCEKCHGVEMPHPGTWRVQHGAIALKQSDVCVKCHQSTDKTFCIRCHGVEMPHTAYWYSSHGDIARRDPQMCYQCHQSRERFCNECHHAGFAPTPQWGETQHGGVVVIQGAGACFACHAEQFCADCHAGKGVSFRP